MFSYVIMLLISGLWLEKVIVDVDVCFIEGIFTLLNNVFFHILLCGDRTYSHISSLNDEGY